MGRWDRSLLSPAPRLAVVTVILLLQLQLSLAGAPPEPNLGDSVSAVSTNKTECSKPEACARGVVLPIWEPQNPSFGDKVARATVYFVALVYMFLGVSIIADRFMASIEVITSQEKEITIKKPNGETTTTTVRIWNETVSNLTLMALGSSAPEILLSVIEVMGHGFQAGTLGPSTIVGSAAFNMFVIIGICVYVVPDGETRKVKHLRVFFVTASWSIFAYIWLYLILCVISPGVVQVWEALLTFMFFPICVVFAWVADRRLLFYKYVYKRYRTGKQRGMIIETEGDRPLPSKVYRTLPQQVLLPRTLHHQSKFYYLVHYTISPSSTTSYITPSVQVLLPCTLHHQSKFYYLVHYTISPSTSTSYITPSVQVLLPRTLHHQSRYTIVHSVLLPRTLHHQSKYYYLVHYTISPSTTTLYITPSVQVLLPRTLHHQSKYYYLVHYTISPSTTTSYITPSVQVLLPRTLHHQSRYYYLVHYTISPGTTTSYITPSVQVLLPRTLHHQSKYYYLVHYTISPSTTTSYITPSVQVLLPRTLHHQSRYYYLVHYTISPGTTSPSSTTSYITPSVQVLLPRTLHHQSRYYYLVHYTISPGTTTSYITPSVQVLLPRTLHHQSR